MCNGVQKHSSDVYYQKKKKNETPTQLFSFEYCENFKNTYSEEHLRGSLYPLHVTSLFLYPLKTSKNKSFRYFQWLYKETNGAEWVNTPLYKSKAIFVCVSVDQALIPNEKDVKNLKLFDFLCRRVSITFIKIKS